MNLRLLKPAEKHLLKGKFDDDDWIPADGEAIIVVAEDEDGRLIGFLAAQHFIHLEPLWVAPRYRGSRVSIRLYALLMSLVRRVYDGPILCSTGSKGVGRFLQRNGWKQIEVPTYEEK